MNYPNIFTKDVSEQVIERINTLSSQTTSKWGTMCVDQMLAHCSVTYEMIYEDKHKKPGAFARFMLKTFVKGAVVGDKPYPKSSRTAPAFLIADRRNFEEEKRRLVNFIRKTQELGENHFDGKVSRSFGKLNKLQWNVMFYKHLDHHLKQFGA